MDKEMVGQSLPEGSGKQELLTFLFMILLYSPQITLLICICSWPNIKIAACAASWFSGSGK